MKELRGRVAVVTGAASGIGRAMARCFAGEGMRVVLADVEDAPLAAAAAELSEAGATVLAVPTDVARAEAVEELARRTLDAFGAVHVLCNNAGVYTQAAAWDQTPGDWAWVLGVNLWGVIHGIRVFVPILLDQGGEGHVVNTASGAGLVAVPGGAPYNASKHAVVAISETLHHDLAARDARVRVSVIIAGYVNTGIGNAERNRPRNFANNPTTTHRTEADRRAHDAMRAAMAGATPPETVAGQVVDAIREERFYVLTDGSGKFVARVRCDDILAERNPTNTLDF